MKLYPDALDRSAGRVLDGADAPLPERVAFLRAAYEVRGPKEALSCFAKAIAGAPGMTAADTETLRDFAVGYLIKRAERVPEARAFVEMEVFLKDTADVRLRREAARTLFRLAGADDLGRLTSELTGLTDAEVARGAVEGLGLNGISEARTALDVLAQSHPDDGVRRLAQEEIGGARQPRAGAEE